MSLTFRQQLVGNLMLASLVPLVLCSAVSIYLSYTTAYDVAEKGLSVAQDSSAHRVEDYLNGLRLLIIEQAQRDVNRNALKDMATAEKNFDTSSTTVDAGKLRDYYAGRQKDTPDTKSGDENSWIPTDAAALALQHLYVSNNSNPVGEKQKLDDAKDGGAYSVVHAKFHPYARHVVESHGLYDFFLVDAESGRVVYTTFKEMDFQSNVKSGAFADTSFSKVVKQALDSKDPTQVFFSEFASYLPSKNEKALFVAVPMVEEGKTIGALAFQLPVEKLGTLVADANKFGKTVQSFVAGPDLKLRTSLPDGSLKVGDHVEKELGPHLNDLFAGKDVSFVEYVGDDGLPMNAYMDKLDVPGWPAAVVVGIDNAEMMATTMEQIYVVLGFVVAMVILALVGGLLLSRVLVQPVQGLAKSFEGSAHKVADMTGQVTEALAGMVAATEETSKQSTIVRTNSSEAAGHVKNVSQAVAELNISINDISQSIGEANTLIDVAVDKAKHTDGVVRNLGEAAHKITEVVSLINGLADQTNLLALNAAIEAARAGDAGRGFAVVADEVKKLANNTSSATVEIQEQIRNIQHVSEQSISALQEVVNGIHHVRDSATTVSAAVEEQSGVVKQIAASVEEAAQRVSNVDSNMQGIEQATNDTGVAADQVCGSLSGVKDAFAGLQGEVAGVLRRMGVSSSV